MKRLRRHLTPPMVVSVIALFVALGGGYAMAFSGSGTLQKGSVVGVPRDSGGGGGLQNWVTVRTLTGIGSLQAACRFSQDWVHVRVLNLREEDMTVSVLTARGTSIGQGYTLIDGQDSEEISMTNGEEENVGAEQLHLHIFPTDGDKAPQATLDVAITAAGVCSASAVTALALNTQQ